MEKSMMKSATVFIAIATVFYAEQMMMVSCVPVNMGNSCKSIPFDMKIKEKGCEETSIRNSYCMGHCVSQVFSTSGNCKICIPDERYKKIIFLKCKKIVDGLETFVKSPRQIEIVKSCSCNKCPKLDMRRYFSRSMAD